MHVGPCQPHLVIIFPTICSSVELMNLNFESLYTVEQFEYAPRYVLAAYIVNATGTFSIFFTSSN